MVGRILIALVLVGCGGGDDGPAGSTGDMGTGTGMSMGMSMSSPSSTTPATSDAGMTDDSASSSGTPPASSSSEDSGPPPGSSSSGSGSDEAGGNCDPEGEKSDCFMCVAANCCQVWSTCMNDEGCACVIDCHVTQGNSLGSCESSCDSDGELYQAVFFCGQMYCLNTCDWDCC